MGGGGGGGGLLDLWGGSRFSEPTIEGGPKFLNPSLRGGHNFSASQMPLEANFSILIFKKFLGGMPQTPLAVVTLCLSDATRNEL